MVLPSIFGSTVGAPATVNAVGYEIVGFEIPRPLTAQRGDAERGRAIVRDAANASCLICHHMPIPEEPDHGNIGPDLAGVAARYSEGELRLRVVDPKFLNPNTVMPAYYSTQGLNRVETEYLGRTIYSAQDVEDVVAYLLSLNPP